MKMNRYIRASISLLSVALLASCGGGGDDEAGAAEPYSISPATHTVTWPAGSPTCLGDADTVVVSVFGGAAPYQIGNISYPSLITVDKTSIPKNGSFTVSFSGGCFDPGTIVVVDALGRQATLTLANKIGT